MLCVGMHTDINNSRMHSTSGEVEREHGGLGNPPYAHPNIIFVPTTTETIPAVAKTLLRFSLVLRSVELI